MQVEEVVVRREETASIILRAEAKVWLDYRAVAARYVVGHAINDYLKPLVVDALDHRAELIQPLRWIIGVIRADVEVVTNGESGNE